MTPPIADESMLDAERTRTTDVLHRPPDREPRFVHELAQRWYDLYLARGADIAPPTVEGSRVRASWAGKCARELSYNVAGLPPSNPPGLADAWNMGLGTMIHNELEDVMRSLFPDGAAEVEHRVSFGDGLGSATLDILVYDKERKGGTNEAWTTVIEVKTTGGYSYKRKIGERYDAEGPDFRAVVQGALGAEAVGADELIIAYLARERLSVNAAAKAGIGEVGRFAAEWSFTPAEFLPLAAEERRRLAKVCEAVDAGVKVPRSIPQEMPTVARVSDPLTGAWAVTDSAGNLVLAGTTYFCPGCWQQQRCVDDGP